MKPMQKCVGLFVILDGFFVGGVEEIKP